MSIPLDELTQARADMAAAIMDKTASIYHPTTSRNSSGVTVSTYPGTPTYAGVACNLSIPSGAFLQLLGEKRTSTTTYVLSMPYGTDLHEGDHVVIGSTTYDVDNVLSPESFEFMLHAFVVTSK